MPPGTPRSTSSADGTSAYSTAPKKMVADSVRIPTCDIRPTPRMPAPVTLRARLMFFLTVFALKLGSGTTSAQPPDCFVTRGSGFLRFADFAGAFVAAFVVDFVGFGAVRRSPATVARSLRVEYCDAVGRLLVAPRRSVSSPSCCPIARLAMFIPIQYDYGVFLAEF
jgi:hypothetical protein